MTQFVKFRLIGGGHSELIWGKVLRQNERGLEVVIDNDPASPLWNAGETVIVPNDYVLDVVE